MAFYGKEFKYDKEDGNFPAFVKSLKLPAKIEEDFIASKPVLKLEKNGDTFTRTIKIGDKVYSLTFKSGVEFEETWGEIKYKSTYVVDGNTVNHVNVRDGRKYFIKSEYTDTKQKETYSGDNFEGVAVRYFQAV